MKKTLLFVMSVIVIGAGSLASADVTGVAFEAVNVRPANDVTSGYADLNSYSYSGTYFTNQMGVNVKTTAGGQKIAFGTQYFNGWGLDQIQTIAFTYKDGPNATLTPYINLMVTNGLGGYGVLTLPSPDVTTDSTPSDQEGEVSIYKTQFNVAGSANFYFYEPANISQLHGSKVDWGTIENWDLLGVGATRPLSQGENDLGSPRAPQNQGLAILWGDSQSNYLGYRQIYDVVVTTVDGRQFTAVVPAPGAIVLGMMGLGLVGWVKRRMA